MAGITPTRIPSAGTMSRGRTGLVGSWEARSAEMLSLQREGRWALQTARCGPRPGPAAPLLLLASQGFLFPSYNRVLANAFFCIP